MQHDDDLTLKAHPIPRVGGHGSLFKFGSVNESHPEYLSDLLVRARLFHCPANQLNDPFECRPHWNFPSSAQQEKKFRKRLDRVMKERTAENRWSRRRATSTRVAPKAVVKAAIRASVQKVFSQIRLCSLTTSNENLLLWSHYANAHAGYCIEFDATKPPISVARKVAYQVRHPELQYPYDDFQQVLIPALTKSVHWQYEQEYRSILYPGAKVPLPNDGMSYLLQGNEIKAIYLGARMSEEHRDMIERFIDSGPFKPEIWQAKLSPAQYKLRFDRCR